MLDTEKHRKITFVDVLVVLFGIGLLLLFIGGLIYFFQFEVYMTIWGWLTGLFLALFKPPVYMIFLRLGSIIAGVPALIMTAVIYISIFTQQAKGADYEQ